MHNFVFVMCEYWKFNVPLQIASYGHSSADLWIKFATGSCATIQVYAGMCQLVYLFMLVPHGAQLQHWERSLAQLVLPHPPPVRGLSTSRYTWHKCCTMVNEVLCLCWDILVPKRRSLHLLREFRVWTAGQIQLVSDHTNHLCSCNIVWWLRMTTSFFVHHLSKHGLRYLQRVMLRYFTIRTHDSYYLLLLEGETKLCYCWSPCNIDCDIASTV